MARHFWARALFLSTLHSTPLLRIWRAYLCTPICVHWPEHTQAHDSKRQSMLTTYCNIGANSNHQEGKRGNHNTDEQLTACFAHTNIISLHKYARWCTSRFTNSITSLDSKIIISKITTQQLVWKCFFLLWHTSSVYVFRTLQTSDPTTSNSCTGCLWHNRETDEQVQYKSTTKTWLVHVWDDFCGG